MTAPLARVVHSVPGRARLRVPGAKGDAEALGALQTALEDVPSVCDVRVNPLTGSILVVHDGPIGDILRQVEQRGGVRVDAGTPEPWLASMHRSLIASDERLKAASKGAIDLETLSFVGFVAGGIYQCLNHHGLPAGVTMLRYAVGLATSKAIDEARAAVSRLPTDQSSQA